MKKEYIKEDIRKILRNILIILLFCLVLISVHIFAVEYISSLDFNVTNPHREDAFKAYAQWNESVNGSYVAYNMTNSDTTILTNYTSGNETYNNTWTNYTIPLNNTWSVGIHLVRIYVTSTWESADIQNVTEANFTLWGWSNLTWIEPTDGVYKGDTVYLLCNVSDSNTTANLEDYPVYFYNETTSSSDSIGTNQTNSSGIGVYYWTIPTVLTPGVFYPRCNITDNATLYYNISENYEANTTIEIWGWSEINESSHFSSVNAGTTTKLYCRVRDANTTSPMSGYNVTFYDNSTGYIGSGLTNSSGWANISKSWSTAVYNITCNITDDASLYYNASESNTNYSTITVTALSTTTTPTTIPSGGGDGGIPVKKIHKKVKAWTKLTPGKAEIMKIDDPEIGLKQISITVKNPAQTVTITVTKLEGQPATVVHVVSGKVYKYIEIETKNLEDENIAEAKIQFQVNKSWIYKNNIGETTIVLNRYHDNKWNKLPTQRVSEDSNYVYYEAETPGFTTFVITGEVVITTTTATITTVPVTTSVPITTIMIPLQIYSTPITMWIISVIIILVIIISVIIMIFGWKFKWIPKKK